MSIVVEPLPVLSLPPASSSSFATTPPKLPPRPPPKLQTVMRVESVSFNSSDLVISPPISPLNSNQIQANNSSVVSPFRFKDHEHGSTEYVRVPSRTSSNMSFTTNNADTNFYYANSDYTNKGTFLSFLAAIFHSLIDLNKKIYKNESMASSLN